MTGGGEMKGRCVRCNLLYVFQINGFTEMFHAKCLDINKTIWNSRGAWHLVLYCHGKTVFWVLLEMESYVAQADLHN